jgi:hypothetical protein
MCSLLSGEVFSVQYSKGKLTFGLTILNKITLPPNVFNSGVEEESKITDVALEHGLFIYLKIEFVP